MKIAFDLDGTLDRESVRKLCLALLGNGDEVHIITGIFDEGGNWQGEQAKKEKLTRLCIPWQDSSGQEVHRARLHCLHAMDASYPREYRLADLGLRKGALCQELQIPLLIDDSLQYCEMAPKMYGDLTVMHVR